MKKIAKIISLLIVTAFLFGCSQNAEQSNQRDETTEPLISESESMQLTEAKTVTYSDDIDTLIPSPDGTYKFQAIIIEEGNSWKAIDTYIYSYTKTNGTRNEVNTFTAYTKVTARNEQGKANYQQRYPNSSVTWDGLKGTSKKVSTGTDANNQARGYSIVLLGPAANNGYIYSNTTKTKFYEHFYQTSSTDSSITEVYVCVVKQ